MKSIEPYITFSDRRMAVCMSPEKCAWLILDKLDRDTSQDNLSLSEIVEDMLPNVLYKNVPFCVSCKKCANFPILAQIKQGTFFCTK